VLSVTQKQRPLRVLHYLPSSVRGGVEEHAISIVNALGSYGCVPYVAGPPDLLRAIEPDVTRNNVRTISVEISSPLDWRGRIRLGAHLRRERIDLLHCHMFDATLYAAPVARIVRVPCIVETNHGAEIWRQNKLIKGSFWVDRQLSRLVDRFIAVSHAAGDHLRIKKKIRADKIKVIHNGRDLSRFVPLGREQSLAARERLRLDGKRVILVLGRLDVQKGHAFLIDALSRLRSDFSTILALFAGEGPLEDELRRQCKARNLTDIVRFLGFSSEPASLLAAADVVVLPSLWEGLPLVAIEALALARPMVATDIPGTSEIVLHQKTGLLVPPANSAALAQAIASLLRNADLAQRLGRQGRTYVENHFDERVQIEQTVEVYRELFPAQRLDRPGNPALSRTASFAG